MQQVTSQAATPTGTTSTGSDTAPHLTGSADEVACTNKPYRFFPLSVKEQFAKVMVRKDLQQWQALLMLNFIPQRTGSHSELHFHMQNLISPGNAQEVNCFRHRGKNFPILGATGHKKVTATQFRFIFTELFSTLHLKCFGRTGLRTWSKQMEKGFFPHTRVTEPPKHDLRRKATTTYWSNLKTNFRRRQDHRNKNMKNPLTGSHLLPSKCPQVSQQ